MSYLIASHPLFWFFALEEPGGFQHAEELGYGGQGHGERFGQLGDHGLAAGQDDAAVLRVRGLGEESAVYRERHPRPPGKR